MIRHHTGNFQSFQDWKHSFMFNPVSTSDEVSRSSRAVAAARSRSVRNHAVDGPSGSHQKPSNPQKSVMAPSMINNHCHPFTAGSFIWKTPKEISPLKAEAKTAKDCIMASRKPISPRV